jgi:hypothetical protein
MRELPIRVSRKILADVSSGIYRTPANALKEIVSNAFDARATRVRVSTNVPYFDIFTCEDDGDGMSAEDFIATMKRIGSSAKRAAGKVSCDGRPIIGKIGIGLLAVAQICNKFSVISKRRGSKTYFQATIGLKQFDEIEREDGYRKGEGEISLGRYEIDEDLTDEVGPERHYTKIVMQDIKEGFRKRLVDEEARKIFRVQESAAQENTFEDFMESVKDKKFNELSQYDQLIWELGLLCPVEYIDGGPLPNNRVLKSEIFKLKSYDFKVFVDGYEIRKPIRFPTSSDLGTASLDVKTYPHISFDEEVDGSRLVFTGYIFHQRKRVQPAELQGVLIRIKGVGVGGYDRTFLHYPKSEGPMFSQLSGEIFVDQGLEEALNIDRNSFNETHRHYLILQKYLWDYLSVRPGVFNDIRNRSKVRRDQIRSEEADKELVKFVHAIGSRTQTEIIFKRHKGEGDAPYEYDRATGKVTFYRHPFWAKRATTRLVQEKVIIAMAAARSVAKDMDQLEKVFMRLFAHRK